MHNVDTRHLLIPDNYRPWNSKLEAKYLSRLNISVQLGLQRNFQTSSLAHMKSLHTLAPIQSPYDSHMTSEQYTQYSMSQCWNQHSQIKFRIRFNQRPYPSLSKTNPNSRFPTSLTPRLTTDITANFNTLSYGQATKALTKKPLGSTPLNLEMLPNLLQIFTWPILPSQALSQIFEVQNYFIIIEVFTLYYKFNKSYYSFRVESTSLFTNPASNLFTMHSNRAFCCSIRAFLLSLLSFNSTNRSLVWSRVDFTPISSSCCQSSPLKIEGPLGPVPLPSVSASDSSTRTLFSPHFPFPADPLVFRLQTRTPPKTVQMTFLKEQWSQDFWQAPSAGQIQYCLCHRQRSQAQSPLVPPSVSTCLSFQFHGVAK